MQSLVLIVLTISQIHLYMHASKTNAFQEPTQRCPRMCTCGLYNELNMANCR